jgi:hypothetical protein
MVDWRLSSYCLTETEAQFGEMKQFCGWVVVTQHGNTDVLNALNSILEEVQPVNYAMNILPWVLRKKNIRRPFFSKNSKVPAQKANQCRPSECAFMLSLDTYSPHRAQPPWS